jgi:hypothetical protein
VKLIPGPDGSFHKEAISIEMRCEGELLQVTRFADLAALSDDPARTELLTPEQSWEVLTLYRQVAEGYRTELAKRPSQQSKFRLRNKNKLLLLKLAEEDKETDPALEAPS